MKFTIQRDQFLKPLQLVNGVVERRQTLPVLGNVLLSAKENSLLLTGTDLEVELSCEVSLSELVESGDITVPARKLFDICRSLPENCEIKLNIEHYKVLLKAGNSRFSLTTLPASEFPKAKQPTEGVEFSIDVNALRQLIERTQFAIAQQDVRYYLNGCLWEIEDDVIRVVATDGHRLAMCQAKIRSETAINSAKAIVPRKAILELARTLQDIDESINVIVGSNHVQFVCSHFTLSTKLIEGRFPDYQKVIPKGGKNELIIQKEVLKPVLLRVAILSNEKYRGVRLTLEQDSLKIMANNPEHEEAEEIIVANYRGEPLELGINVNYLIDVLNTTPTENVIFTFINAEKSVLVEGEKDSTDVLNVIMPMRL